MVVSGTVCDKVPGSAGTKSRSGAVDASVLRCENPRNEDERTTASSGSATSAGGFLSRQPQYSYLNHVTLPHYKWSVVSGFTGQLVGVGAQ